MPEDVLAALFIVLGQQYFFIIKWLGVKIQSTHFWCFLKMLKFTRFFGGPNGPKISGRRTETDFRDRAERCRRNIVKMIFFCGLRVGYLSCWKGNRDHIAFCFVIQRKARYWCKRLVSGRRRQRMNWSRRWAEHHYNQHHFFRATWRAGPDSVWREWRGESAE